MNMIDNAKAQVRQLTVAAYEKAAAAGLLFTLVATPVTLFVKYMLEKFGPSAE